MSAQYRPVIWNTNKIIYDAILLIAVAVYILAFLRLAPMALPAGTEVDFAHRRMAAFGSCAFLMLTFILCIGPLARLDRRWLPVLYNRRHFGVMTCIVALIHASHVLGWYYAYSDINPYVALLSINPSLTRLVGFPFELFGLFALIILIVLAVTSHDFWLKFLQPKIWKALHMSVYAAYTAIVIYVAFGAMQQDGRSPVLALVVAFSVCMVAGLHLMAAYRTDDETGVSTNASRAGWVQAGKISSIAEGRGMVVRLAGGENIAIFRHGGKLSAISNACAHQNGPLGEGCIIDGLVTCPWHGYQYRPDDGCAPAPFTEKLHTYNLAIDCDDMLLDPRPNPPGTRVEPVVLPQAPETV